MSLLYDEDSVWTRHDNGMEAIAEACATPEEVEALIFPLMDNAFRRAKKTHCEIGSARSMVRIVALKFLGEHYYVLPEQERRINKRSRKLLKGYQKWWKKVERMRKRLEANRAQTGQGHINPRAEALARISPELYRS
jgi:hypothetical protein